MARWSNIGVKPVNATSQTSNARGLYQQALDLYKPGGSYLKGIQAMLERLGTKSQASGFQNLARAGLGNTSMIGGLANRFAEETAAPQLAGAESQRNQSMADILMQMAQFEGNRPDVTHTTTIGKMAPSIFDMDRAKTLAKASGGGGTASAAPQSLPRLDLHTPAPAAAKPSFSQAFVGDPNVMSSTGRNIGTRLTGTYDLGTGKLLDNYTGPSRSTFNVRQ